MSVYFCDPILTIGNKDNALDFFNECKKILDMYILDKQYISTSFQIDQLMDKIADKNDIFIFFNAKDGNYNKKMRCLFNMFHEAQSRIWAVAMERNPECRRTPEPLSDRQSFDVSSMNENRNPMKNNMKAIAQLFSRKIIAQTLSPLYQDEVLYFISHKRTDGEHIAAKLADELKLLTRKRNVYRDVINVEVGEEAQKDIDDNLKNSDVVIFLQTEQAQFSAWIMKELCYALVHDIPVLWIQIDHASYEQMEIRPGDKPLLQYDSTDFDDSERMIEIAEEVEEKCFHLIMNSSKQVYSYIEYLQEMKNTKRIHMVSDLESMLAYEIEYKEKTADLYDQGIKRHYIQCFGRNPKSKDIDEFVDKIKQKECYQRNDKLFLLSNHGDRKKTTLDSKVIEENYDDYIMNLEKMYGLYREKKNKRIILSGAFPDYDEIYKVSLLEALIIYSKEIIKNGYILVFGAHPTFQNIIFDIGALYSSDVKYSIEMHMDRKYISEYNIDELSKKCNLILSDGLQEMRKNMICNSQAEMMICLGGKIKEDKMQQGVDEEIELARESGIPVALVGTVGGRSSEYAFEKLSGNSWADINTWEKSLNESLFYNLNHRLMIRQLLNKIE